MAKCVFRFRLFALSSSHATAILMKKGVTVDVQTYKCHDLDAFTNVTWWYDWAVTDSVHHEKGCAGTPKGDFLSMVWGYTGQRIIIQESSTHVQGFNEPNHKEQSHMTPEYAASSWRILEQAAGDLKLLSPAPARCDSVGDLCTYTWSDWLDQFFEACKGCRVDYMAVHSYTCDVDNDMSFLETVYKRYGRKVWLTEFACPGKPSAQKVFDYMSTILPKLEKADYVAGYAWFTGRILQDGYISRENSLLNAKSSTLTPLGRLYNSRV